MISYDTLPKEINEAFTEGLRLRKANKKKPEIKEALDELKKITSWYDWDYTKNTNLANKKMVYIFLNQLTKDNFKCDNPKCTELTRINSDITKNSYCSKKCKDQDYKEMKEASEKVFKKIREAKEKEIVTPEKPAVIAELTQKQLNVFKRNCKLKFNAKYGYAKTYFKSTQDLVIVNCPEHGDFEVQVMDHLRGIGCPECLN